MPAPEIEVVDSRSSTRLIAFIVAIVRRSNWSNLGVVSMVTLRYFIYGFTKAYLWGTMSKKSFPFPGPWTLVALVSGYLFYLAVKWLIGLF
ncbi:hypothetical protein GCM10028825_02410 [Spirosoma agri]